MNYKIGKLEGICLIIIVMMNKILLNIPKEIIKQSKTGAPLNIIFTGFLAIVIVIIITNFFKKFQNEDIIDIADYLGKKPLQIIVGIPFIFLFALIILTSIYKFTDLLKMLYFPSTPSLFIFIAFFVCIGFANKIGFRGIVKSNVIISITLLISLAIILYGAFENYNINRLYPILGQNIHTTFIKGSQNLFAYSGILYMFFIQPLLKNKNDLKKISIISILISEFFLLSTSITLIMIFPFISYSDELMSMYLLTRNIVFGKFFQRIEAVFIFLWIISAFSYLSISLFFLTSIIKRIINCKESNNIQYSVLGILLGILLIFHNQAIFTFLEVTLFKYLVLCLVPSCIFLLLLANIKKRNKI